MTDTTVTTLTNSVPAEFIAAQIIDAAYPFNVVAPLCYTVVKPEKTGLVWNRSIAPVVTAASVAEASDITTASRTTTQGTVTIGEVGSGTSITQIAQEVAVVGADLMYWAGAAGRAIAQKKTGDLCALFAGLNASTTVGTTDTNITVANFIEAMYTLDANNAPGQRSCVLHPRQWADLMNALAAGTGPIYSNLAELVRDGRLPNGTPAAGFMGQLFGVPIYQTTEVDTANSAVDRVGAMFVPEAMAVVNQRPVTVKFDNDESARRTEVIVTTTYGVGELVETYGVSITTDA